MESPTTDELDLKTIGGYTAGILIFMSAMRLLLETQAFGIPIMDFISFSNMIVYVLDILYGTTIFIIISCLIILFRGKIDDCITKKQKKNSWGLKKWPLFIMILASGIVVFLVYELVPTTYWLGMGLKFVIFVGIGFTGIWLKYCCDIKEYNFLLTILIFVFIFLSTKIVISYENYLYTSKQPIPTTIIFKDPKMPPFTSGSRRRFVSAKMDFVFTYDSTKESYTAYPMAEIFSIENRGK